MSQLSSVGYQSLHPPSSFIIITQPESWYSFYRPRWVEGWVDLVGWLHTEIPELRHPTWSSIVVHIATVNRRLTDWLTAGCRLVSSDQIFIDSRRLVVMMSARCGERLRQSNSKRQPRRQTAADDRHQTYRRQRHCRPVHTVDSKISRYRWNAIRLRFARAETNVVLSRFNMFYFHKDMTLYLRALQMRV